MLLCAHRTVPSHASSSGRVCAVVRRRPLVMRASASTEQSTIVIKTPAQLEKVLEQSKPKLLVAMCKSTQCR